MTVVRMLLTMLVAGALLVLAPSSGWCVEANPAAEELHSEDAADDGHGAAGDAHAEHGSADPMSADLDLAIFTLIIFLVLLAVLSKFAWKPIVAGLERREAMIAENIAAAQRSNEDAKAMLAQYEARLSGAHEEVRGIIEEARRDAEHTQQEILAKARADAQTEMNRALREVETAKDQALKELAEASANQAVTLASRILRSQVQQGDHQRLIDEAMSGFVRGNGSQN